MFLHVSVILSTGGGRQTPPRQAETPPPPPSRTATAADGTHPTGMHTCFLLFFLKKIGSHAIYDHN